MKRLVAVGKVNSPHPTVIVKYAVTDPHWKPQNSDEEAEIDYDLIRKIELESAH